MNAKLFSRLSLLLCLFAGLSSCIIRGYSRYEPQVHKHAGEEHGDGEAAEVQEDALADSDREFDFKLAKLEHERSQMRIKGELAEAAFSLASARVDVKDAERVLNNFAAQRQVRLDDAQLGLDRSIGSAGDAELELAELQAMYDEEDFAEKTKELVLERGRRNLEHSKRRLAIAKEEMRQLVELELPGEERGLKWSLKSAMSDLGSAEREMAIAKVGEKIDSLQAEHDLEEARSEYKAGA